jgi:pyruvate/2-oxoglutarate/acetoin dehydrogenase E1 component
MDEGGQRVTQTKMVADLVASLLRADDRRVAIGEDVRDGGMLGLSRVAAEDDALRGQLWSTPLTNAGIWSHAIGLARAGRRPIVLPSSGSDVVAGAPVLREALSPGAPDARGLLIITVSGPGFGLGGSDAACVDSELARVPGLRVSIAGSVDDGPRLVAEAGDEPTLVLLPRSLALLEPAGDESESSAAGAHVQRPSTSATVFTWGGARPRAEQAIAALGAIADGVGLVDVRSLSPLDETTLVAEAKTTGRIVIAHPGPRGGVAAELAALFADHAILSLDAPIVRVAGEGEAEAGLPSVTAIADAIEGVLTY